MTARGSMQCSALLSSSARTRPTGDTNTCVPTRATGACSIFARYKATAISLTLSADARRPTSSGATPKRRPDAGLLRCAIAGSTVSANYSCAMSRPITMVNATVSAQRSDLNQKASSKPGAIHLPIESSTYRGSARQFLSRLAGMIIQNPVYLPDARSQASRIPRNCPG